MKPLATDLSAYDFVAARLGEVPAGTTLHCRLGGTSTGGDITPSEDNANGDPDGARQVGAAAAGAPASSYPPGLRSARSQVAAQASAAFFSLASFGLRRLSTDEPESPSFDGLPLRGPPRP